MQQGTADTAAAATAALISAEHGVTAVDGAQEVATGQDMATFTGTPTTEDMVIPIILILTGIGQPNVILMACATESGSHIIERRERKDTAGTRGTGTE